MLYVLILLMVLDILTGTAKAIKDRRLWSRKGLFGYGRKILIFVIIVVSNVRSDTSFKRWTNYGYNLILYRK